MASRTLPAEMVAMAMRVPHVKTGYRPMYQPISYYIWSLFYWHNETVNVWTHFIGCLCMLSMNIYYFKIYSSNNSPLRWTLMGHGLCCCLTLLNSAIAHLLHSRSCYMNFVVFMFDYIGVVNWVPGTQHWLQNAFFLNQNTYTQLNQGNYNCPWTRKMHYDVTKTCTFKVNGFTYKYTLQDCQ